MSRVISQKNSPRERRLALKMIAGAIAGWEASSDQAVRRECAAFITLTLEQIGRTVDSTVTPWEKRGYWLKADKFRQEWDWVFLATRQLCDALVQEDWAGVGRGLEALRQRLSRMGIQTHQTGGSSPSEQSWLGSWAVLQKKGCGEGALRA